MSAKNYHFFYGSHHIYSQWHPIAFTVARSELAYLATPTNTAAMDSIPAHVSFSTAEQYMMYGKAVFFDDGAVAAQVLAAPTPREQKALGRKVSGFEERAWVRVREQIVEQATWAKFSQNEKLRAQLLGTGDKVMVEASPRDRIWGIGFGEGNALKNQTRWGLNLLGKAIIRVRDRLRAEEELEKSKIFESNEE